MSHAQGCILNRSVKQCDKMLAVKTTVFSDILIQLGEFFDICQNLDLHAQAEAGRFGFYRARINQLGEEISRLRAGEPEMPIYEKFAADLPTIPCGAS